MTTDSDRYQPNGAAPLPSFIGHLSLLWKTRKQLSQQGLGLHPTYLQRLISVLALVPALSLGLLSYLFITHPSISTSIEISQFYLNLLCFVTALQWITWPVLSAGVEDASESRSYQSYPISTSRLLVASTLTGLLRPVGFFMFAPIIGAVVGYTSCHVSSDVLMVPFLFLAFIALCAGWGQVALYWMRDILRSHRSGQALGSVLIMLIVLGTLLPPVDTSWLYQENAEGIAKLGLELQEYAQIAYTFSRVPTGYLGEALRALHDGRPLAAMADALAMLLLAAVGLFTAQILLSHSQHGKSSHSESNNAMQAIILNARNTHAALVRREALALWRNPRVRLLLAVPLVLMVMFRLFSAHDMFVFFFGQNVDAWLMAVLATYAALLMATTFTQNMFAEDGQGLYQLLAAPITPEAILRAKAEVHALLIGLAGLGSTLFYALYIGKVSLQDYFLVSLGVSLVIPLTLILGLFLSIYFPVSTDANLNRRSRQSLAVSLAGFLGNLVGTSPLFFLINHRQAESLYLWAYPVLLILLGLMIALYRYLLPIAGEHFNQRRERILAQIGRF
jgi:ABC-2 type transport system permease protein